MPFFGGGIGDYHIVVTNITGGTDALPATGGSNNMALGNAALQSAVLGDNNIAIGNNAAVSATQPYRSVIIGESAGITPTGASSLSDCVIVGADADGVAASSSGFVAIGSAAKAHTSCISIGEAAIANIGGNASQFFGSIAIGAGATTYTPTLAALVGNIAIGDASTSGVGGGGNNIVFGQGCSAGTNNNIAIGNNVKVFNLNVIAIGHNIDSSTGPNNAIIIGDASHTTVKIGGVTLSGTSGSLFSSAIIGDAGTEGSGINVGGVTYDALLKVSDISSSDIAQSIIHRHSTTWEPIQVFARSNSNGSGHGVVTNGMALSSVYTVGWTGTEYNLASRIHTEVSAVGTVSDTSIPADLVFSVTPDGSAAPVEAVRIKSDKSVVFKGGVVLPSSTWAALPAAATATGQNYFVSDVGLRGGVFYSDGVNWIPNNESLVLGCGAIPVGVPSGGTVSANGALTLTTAFPTIYSGGIWLYFPAGAVYAGSLAGLYWTVMSSTTVGVIYNDRRDGTATWLPSMKGTATPIVAAGPGAYTQTTTELTVSTDVLNGGLMGTLGAIRGINTLSFSNSANTKVFNTKLAGTPINAASITTASNLNQFVLTRNRGVNNLQVNNQYLGIQVNVVSAGSISYTAIDTSVNCNYTITITTANNADYGVYESVIVELMR